jgi:lipopolysaccharide/colanic/teichoic acid biosynthesis glycosyltransferase
VTVYRRAKRVIDVIGALYGLLLVAPFFPVIAWFIRRDSPGPAIFRQERGGYRGRPFVLYKFRTMREAVDEYGVPLPDYQRLTEVGRFLRATSLDELPSLWNVLIGDMSLVGPRPLFAFYRDRYSPEQARRHDVKPGLTGWAQVNGRNAIEWERKFELDLWYVEHESPLLDLKIILLTIWIILTRRGVNQPGHATAEEFKGNMPQ